MYVLPPPGLGVPLGLLPGLLAGAAVHGAIFVLLGVGDEAGAMGGAGPVRTGMTGRVGDEDDVAKGAIFGIGPVDRVAVDRVGDEMVLTLMVLVRDTTDLEGDDAPSTAVLDLVGDDVLSTAVLDLVGDDVLSTAVLDLVGDGGFVPETP